METIHVKAPAKINLFLRITGKRSDGYHDLCSLMCPLALYDTLTLSEGGKGIVVVCGIPTFRRMHPTWRPVRRACLWKPCSPAMPLRFPV